MSVVLIALAVILAAHLIALLVATRVITASIAAEIEPGGRMVSVAGGRLHLFDLPASDPTPGETILLLHGATANARDMVLALGDALSRHHRVIAIDRPGHGFSDRVGGADSASPARQADLIVAALDELGLDRVVVVGFSLAGAVATNLALDHPTRVSGLVVLAGVTHPWPGGINWYYRLAARPVIGTLFTQTLIAPIGSWGFQQAIEASFAPNAAPAHYSRDAAAALILRPETFGWNAQDVDALYDFIVRQAPRYGEIRVPTAILHGEADLTVYASIHSIPLAQKIAGARLTLLPGIGHMLHHAARPTVLAEIEAVARAARERGNP
ncbi:MAG: alpha/beta fold hydrolase [Labrys sp. (in: a-proteobacteria)]